MFTLVALSLALAAGCGPTADDSSDPDISPADLIQQWEPKDRSRVADFEAQTLDGKSIDAGSMDGVVTVVNVWGSWCGPCRAEAPILREGASKYRDRGVQFLGVNVRDNDASARAFERRYKIPYDSIVSKDAPGVSMAFGRVLTVTAVPTTVVVAADRTIVGRAMGELTAGTLSAFINEALKLR